jgi:hypothetical protein
MIPFNHNGAEMIVRQHQQVTLRCFATVVEIFCAQFVVSNFEWSQGLHVIHVVTTIPLQFAIEQKIMFHKIVDSTIRRLKSSVTNVRQLH